MHLQWLDWIVVAACLLICFAPALLLGRRAGHGARLWRRSGVMTDRGQIPVASRMADEQSAGKLFHDW
jgi:hypothetical protein